MPVRAAIQGVCSAQTLYQLGSPMSNRKSSVTQAQLRKPQYGAAGFEIAFVNADQKVFGVLRKAGFKRLAVYQGDNVVYVYGRVNRSVQKKHSRRTS